MCRLIDEVDQVGGALIVRGEPGSGRTSLLRIADAHASKLGIRVLNARGSAAESTYSFAGLHSLLQPILGHVDRLPSPQRDAILSAFGIEEPAIVEPFLVALGALGLLTRASEHGPLVVLIDDTELLDRATLDVLAFISRRLTSERAVLVMTLVDEPQPFPQFDLELSGARELRLTGLSDDEGHRVIDACAPGLSSLLRSHVLSIARGNPFAIRELASARVSGAQRDGVMPTAVEVPLTHGVVRRFERMLSGLSATTRRILLFASCDESGSIADLVAAAGSLGESADVLDAIAPAVEAGVVVVEGTRITFAHPLLRSAVYQSPGIAARQAAHAAMADVKTKDPLRRAWHRALSISTSSDEIASRLHLAAETAVSRGGSMVDALMAFERAARVSASASARSTSLHAATRAAFELGWVDVARELIRREEALAQLSSRSALEVLARRTIDDLRTDARSDVTAEIRNLVSYARAVDDRSAARRALFRAAVACMWAAPHATLAEAIETTTCRLELASDDPWRLAIVAVVGSVEQLEDVAGRIGRMATADVAGSDEAFALGFAATRTCQNERAAELLSLAVKGFRAGSRIVMLTQALALRAWVAMDLSHFEVAASDASEAAVLASRTSQPLWEARALAALALVAAMRGDDDQATRLSTEADKRATQPRGSAALADASVARGHSHLAQGRFTEATRELAAVYSGRDRVGTTSQQLAAVADFAEASQRAGRASEANDALAALCRALPETIVANRVEIAYASALLAGSEAAEGQLKAILERGALVPPLLSARCHLALGTLLRRSRRTVESRDHLGCAVTEFTALGAARWAERARQELRATGEHRRQSAESRIELTPQEELVVQLAATGLSNQQIGQRLFLSPRTIGAHLYRAFPKLGVASRGELHTALSYDHAAKSS